MSNTTEKIILNDIPHSVATLPVLDITTVDSFIKYQEFMDKVNSLVDMLNENGSDVFNVPKIGTDSVSYSKAAKAITKYGPLIGNYNSVIETARSVDNGDNNTSEFYKAAALFGLEVAMINWKVFGGTPLIYKAVQTEKLTALYHFSIDPILSEVQHTIKDTLIPELSDSIDNLKDSFHQIADSYKK